MIPNIIAFSGAHGTGKTTSVYAMAAKLKKHGVNVGIITETARECPFPVMSATCKTPPEHAQMWIFSRQMQAEIEASERYELVVSDRSCIDCIAYTRAMKYYELAHAMEEMLFLHKQRYLEIRVKTIAENDYCTDDGFRSLDTENRKRIEDIILRLYSWFEMTVHYE